MLKHKVRLFTKRPVVPVSLLEQRLKECCLLVDQYLEAKHYELFSESHSARLKIASFAMPGVYRMGGDASGEMYATYGTQATGKSSREDAFVVPYVRIHQKGDIAAEWQQVSLIGSGGFLMPIRRDGYHGERFVRIGELVHA